jgi:L-iditol 2-dehydrogenase
MSNYVAIMPEVGHIEITEVGEPTPGPRDAIVRIKAVGVRGSATAYYTVGYIGDYVVDGPIVLGHECAGGSSPWVRR